MLNPLGGTVNCRGGEKLPPSINHHSATPPVISCISKMYVSATAAVLMVGGVVHVKLAVHGEMGVVLMSLGGKGGPTEGKQREDWEHG